MNVAVIGHTGRLGSVIAAAVGASDDMNLLTARSTEEVERLTDIDVAIDVTNLEAARGNLCSLAERGINAVVGTTGFDADDQERFNQAFKDNGARCLLAPNFSIGAVLLMRLAAQAAPFFDGVEIIELHHDRKVDAPSGTARHTAEQIAAARTQPWAPDPTVNTTAQGARGGRVGDIPVHSVRLPGLVAHEEVIFGATGQSLTIRHDSYDRSSFVAGALLAVRNISSLPAGLTVGLETLLLASNGNSSV